MLTSLDKQVTLRNAAAPLRHHHVLGHAHVYHAASWRASIYCLPLVIAPLQEEVLRHILVIYNQDRGYDEGLLPGKFWHAIDEMKGAYLAEDSAFQVDPVLPKRSPHAPPAPKRMTHDPDTVLLSSSDHMCIIFTTASMPPARSFGHTAVKRPTKDFTPQSWAGTAAGRLAVSVTL